MFEEFLLQHMESVGLRQALDRLDFFALRFDGEHQAGADRASIDDDRASAAVASQASLFTAGQFEFVAQRFEQTLAGFTKELRGFTVNRGLNNSFLRHLL